MFQTLPPKKSQRQGTALVILKKKIRLEIERAEELSISLIPKGSIIHSDLQQEAIDKALRAGHNEGEQCNGRG